MHEACAKIEVAGEELWGDPSGALYWPAQSMLLVADLHFEKGSAFASKGQMLPPYDTRATLRALDGAIERHKPQVVVALGDSFHDGGAGDRITEDDRTRIQALTAATSWVWLTGNHDEILPEGIGGKTAVELHIGALVLRHEPRAAPARGELAGHLHPAAVVRTRNRALRRRCFAGDGERLILPSFGAFTGGLDITDEAFNGLFTGAPTAWVLGKKQVYEIPPARLSGVA